MTQRNIEERIGIAEDQDENATKLSHALTVFFFFSAAAAD